ncbi:MAG: hypothetical protein C0519_01500 [Hyphomicrobium sp.]|nr:hypothetical protein [Hyphomicrobium sp.]PPD09530.1 MAG: hypothetical protein CTY28_01605 [Hyphomicrobium sp.]
MHDEIRSEDKTAGIPLKLQILPLTRPTARELLDPSIAALSFPLESAVLLGFLKLDFQCRDDGVDLCAHGALSNQFRDPRRKGTANRA